MPLLRQVRKASDGAGALVTMPEEAETLAATWPGKE